MRALASRQITGGAHNRFRFKIKAEAPTSLRDMVALVEGLLSIRRSPVAVLRSMAIMGATVGDRTVSAAGVQVYAVTGPASLVAFWLSDAHRRLNRGGGGC